MSNKIAWSQPFTVMAISREDIISTGFARWEGALTDAEMLQVASLVKASYDNEFFLVRLKAATNHVLLQRPQDLLTGGEHG